MSPSSSGDNGWSASLQAFSVTLIITITNVPPLLHCRLDSPARQSLYDWRNLPSPPLSFNDHHQCPQTDNIIITINTDTVCFNWSQWILSSGVNGRNRKRRRKKWTTGHESYHHHQQVPSGRVINRCEWRRNMCLCVKTQMIITLRTEKKVTGALFEVKC